MPREKPKQANLTKPAKVAKPDKSANHAKLANPAGTRQEFIRIFRSLCTSRSFWQVWTDLMSAISCSLSNFADPDAQRKERREKEYQDCIKRLGGVEAPAQMMAVLVAALDRNPEQDFLGEMFMELGLGSNWHGQFFTPISISRMMAGVCIDTDRARKQIEEKGWISVNDPACGAGSTLIGAIGTLNHAKINWQSHVAFTGCDIDRTAAQMCFIQLSLLGCAGYVTVTNTLSDPVSGSVLFPQEEEGQEFYYTPMWWNGVWTYRRAFHMMDKLVDTGQRKEDHSNMFYLDFAKWEEAAVNE